MAKGPASGKPTITHNGNQANHKPASGKPAASPSNVVTGAGPKGSGNWTSMYPSQKGGKGC